MTNDHTDHAAYAQHVAETFEHHLGVAAEHLREVFKVMREYSDLDAAYVVPNKVLHEYLLANGALWLAVQTCALAEVLEHFTRNLKPAEVSEPAA